MEVGAAGDQSGAGGFAAAAGGAGKQRRTRDQGMPQWSASARCVLHLSRLRWANTWQREGDRGREITGVRSKKGKRCVLVMFLDLVLVQNI